MAQGESSDALEIVRAIYAGWADGNLWAGAELYDEHVVYMPPADDVEEGPFFGLEALTAYMHRWLPTWESWKIEALDSRAVGDTVIARVRRIGVGKGSGIRVEDEVFQLWTLRGGRIIRFEVIADEREALSSVGEG